MTVKSSISLTDEQHAFARALVEAGRYASLSAVLQRGVDRMGLPPDHGASQRSVILRYRQQQIRESWLHDKGMQDFSLFHPDNPILSVDVFTNYPIEFDGLHDRSETCNVGGVSTARSAPPSPLPAEPAARFDAAHDDRDVSAVKRRP